MYPIKSGTAAVLPPLYAGWIDEFLGQSIPAETEATCDNCAMTRDAEEHEGPAPGFFDPGFKCCTYLPRLANFLVGRILADEDPAAQVGRRSVEARVDARIAVTPLGLGWSPSFAERYRSGGIVTFGRDPTMRCPHSLDDGGCGVWRHRESTCATWFCKHVRGSIGHRFWKAIHQLLGQAERSLARWCLEELDLGPGALAHLFPPTGTEDVNAAIGDLDLAAYETIWGNWVGREREFYRACAALVSPLSWDRVTEVAGPTVRLYGQIMRHRFEELVSEDPPRAPRLGSLELVQIGSDFARVGTYSPFDPLDLPKQLIEVLHHFDGRPTAEVLEEIAEQEGIEIEIDLIRQLVDFEILDPPAR